MFFFQTAASLNAYQPIHLITGALLINLFCPGVNKDDLSNNQQAETSAARHLKRQQIVTKLTALYFLSLRVSYNSTDTSVPYQWTNSIPCYTVDILFYIINRSTQKYITTWRLTSILSQPIISPYETWWQRQYVGSLGSTGMSRTSDAWLAARE